MIRKALPTDLDFIVNCQIQMAFETEQLDLDRETVQKGVTFILDNPFAGHYVLMDQDGKTVGCTLLLWEWSDWRNGKVWWIHSLYILTEYRGQGLFSDLYAHLKAEVSADPNARGIRLFVDKTNLSARKIYEHIGMTAEHYEMFEWMK